MSSTNPPAISPLRFLKSPQGWLYALWKFSRPHTIIGTSLSVVSLFLIVLQGFFTPIQGAALPGTAGMLWLLVSVWIACLGGNVYIVGLNQLEDVDIDRINKPHLPLASGEFSRRQAYTIIVVAAAIALGLALTQGRFLTATIVTSLLIGTAYSLPPMRLKRFPFWASFCILAVRGGVVNLGLFLHFSDRLGTGLTIPPKIWALTAFIVVFSIVIAIFKDIPDLEGDRRYNITTFTVKLGQTAVFNLARLTLTGCYLAFAIAAPFLSGLNLWIMAIYHLSAICGFWWLSRRVSFSKPAPGSSYRDFYQFIWKLFFLEYLMFPLACWLG
ncbi:MAG: homogentisate phytyltransferase [Cyanobacteria bacterium P01_A01_bin.123]